MHEFSTRAPGPPDGLFLERLDTFMDKCLADIRAFSEREYRPFDETRQQVAEWHCKHLFQPHSGDHSGVKADTVSRVRAVLYDASRILESLCEVSGVQSFFLAVDPNNPSDQGFLGGPVVGREFWRGMRGGGDAGAKAFKTHCIRQLESYSSSSQNNEETTSRASSTSAKLAPARSLKNDLYEGVRKALRSASGVRKAEMKWTNPERLDMYGVRLVGWPPSIPAQNPSALKVGQNKILQECLDNGTMRFEKLFPPGDAVESADSYLDDGKKTDETEGNDDFSWAYDANAGDSPPPASSSSTGDIRRDNSFQEVTQEPVVDQVPDQTFLPSPSQIPPQMQYDVSEHSRSSDHLASRSDTLPSDTQLPPKRKRLRSDSD